MRQRHSLTLGLVALAIGVLIFPACKRRKQSKPCRRQTCSCNDAATRDVPVYREWIGTLDGSENAEIRARVTGYLLKRDYQEGALVKRTTCSSKSIRGLSRQQLAEAKSQLDQGKAAQIASQAEADRATELFNKRVISAQEFTNKTQLNESSAAKVEALKANVEQAQLNLNFCRITSPVEGIAGISRAQVGDLVGTANSHGAHVGLDLSIRSRSSSRSAKRNISRAANRIQEGMACHLEKRPEFIDLILADGKTFPNKARLLSVDRQVNASTGTILVTAVLKTQAACCGRACLHERASPRAPQGRCRRAATGGDGNPGQLSARGRRRGR